MYQFTFKSQLVLATYFFRQTDLCAQAQFNATVCQFTDIISLRRRHILLGPFRAWGEMQILVIIQKY
ncbi:hypothetical protein QJS67_13735 [Acinetobacter radioresistens]|nr:hypothetical protein QJS67_13735 [Acinetobacter radioresistens]